MRSGNRLETALDRAVKLAEQRGGDAHRDRRRGRRRRRFTMRRVRCCWPGKGSQTGADARRALVARFVLAHRLSPRDPLEMEDAEGEDAAIAMLLSDEAVTLEAVAPLLS